MLQRAELRRHALGLALSLTAPLGVAMTSNPKFNSKTQRSGPCHRFSEVLQRAELRRHALGLALGLAARLAAAAARLGTAEEEAAGALARSPLLPPLHVLLQWLVHQPEMAGCASQLSQSRRWKWPLTWGAMAADHLSRPSA